ncbi:AFG1/ZapE family ATPase [Candidatus Latescibacterota bacterium]
MKRCKVCGGTGIIYDREILVGSVGELRICDCVDKKCDCGAVEPFQVFDKDGTHSWCSCRGARLRLTETKKTFRNSQIPSKYKWKFIEDFDKVEPIETSNKIMGFVDTIRYKNIDEKWTKGFYLWGPAGSGKTLLASIFLQELMLKYSKPGRFIDLSRQFFQRLKRSYDNADELYGTGGRILEDLINVPFLVIDDFGVQRNTEWESEMLYNLIDSRYSEERVTIITSNENISSYKKVAMGRVYSRILEMCMIIHVDLPDYRESLSQQI